MRTLASLAALLAVVVQSAAAQSKVERRHPLAPTGMVRVWNLAGAVVVTGWDVDSVVVRGSIPAGARITSGGNAAGVKVTVEGEGDAVIDVRVPRGAQVWVKSATANVAIEGVEGGVEVYSVSGAVRLRGEPRELVAETMGGWIDADVKTRRMRLRTADGPVRFAGTVDDADITTVSGDIALRAPEFLRARIESVEGGIGWTGTIAERAVLTFVNHTGDIDLALPPGAAGEFVVSTYEGAIENALARATVVPVGTKGRQLSFTLGSAAAAARVEIRNFRGAIRLRTTTGPGAAHRTP